MSRRHLVVFDLDDTLYPERAFALSGFRAVAAHVAERHGISGLDARMITLLDAGHLGALFGIAFGEVRPGHTKEELDALLAVYRSHVPEITLFEDAARALARFSANGPLGLITDGTARMQHAKIDALGIRDTFHRIIATDDLGGRSFSKPHPLSFEQMEAALSAHDAKARLVYVGDNPSKDFIAPNARGWLTVQVLRDASSPARIHANATAPPGGAPQAIIGSLDDLEAVLG